MRRGPARECMKNRGKKVAAPISPAVAAFALGISLAVRAGGAEGPELRPDRLETAILPSVGHTPELGVILGAATVLTRLSPDRDPYRWQHLFLLLASRKGDQTPLRTCVWVGDFPDLGGGSLRLYSVIGATRVVNSDYFGLGNESSDSEPAGSTAEEGKYFKFLHEDITGMITARIPLSRAGDVDLMAGVWLRYLMPGVHRGSKLAEDIADPGLRLYGTGNHGLVEVPVGLVWDTRDHEKVPTRGHCHEIWVRGGAGLSPDDDILHAGVTAHARFYRELGPGRVVLAGRVLADFLFGRPSFETLTTAWGLPFMAAPGGMRAIRGINAGRFRGKAKLVGSVELRSMFFESVARTGTRVRLGWAAFADAGRCWNDYERDPDLDGTGAGLKYGVGGGLHLQWGEMVLLRLDLAYSPDAEEESGLALYLGLDAAF